MHSTKLNTSFVVPCNGKWFLSFNGRELDTLSTFCLARNMNQFASCEVRYRPKVFVYLIANSAKLIIMWRGLWNSLSGFVGESASTATQEIQYMHA